jgi:sterol desaturase/sphingolipid hydroxylase (fatty acid hydroxylase superfamily)
MKSDENAEVPVRVHSRAIVSYLTWPALFAACLAVTHMGIERGQPILFFNITYFGLAIMIFGLERLIPHERRWQKNDGQMGADHGHTVLSKITAQIWVALLLIGVIEVAGEKGGALWPGEWPVFFQIVLGLVVAEFGLYWSHRLAHEWSLLWRFHAVHHSVVRLWFFNTGRFHFVDAFVSVFLGQVMLLIVGAPEFVMLWTGMITPYIGFLTHCNIEMRFGPISYVFNTPGLHRWHHSRDKKEGDTNYGENLMIWDQVFGTFFNPNRRPPTNIGIADYIPQGFLAQLRTPFIWNRVQAATPQDVPDASDAPDAMNRLSLSER